MILRNRLRSPLAIDCSLALGLLLAGCLAPPASGNPTNAAPTTESAPTVMPENIKNVPSDARVATFASGCFWCVESIYESVRGVYEAVSGYAGGSEPNPTYQQVSRGGTHHAESVQVYYNPKEVSFEQLVEVFFASQNPTQVNGQGPDRGPQYRSIVFYSTDEERDIAEKVKAALEASGQYGRPIAAQITRLDKFWKAEDYHQDYEHRNPNQPYIRGVSVPRLERFKAKRPDLLKDSAKH